MPSRARVLETSWGLEPYQNSAKKIPPSLSASQTGGRRDNKIRSEGLAEEGTRSLKHLPETECGRRTQSCANLEGPIKTCATRASPTSERVQNDEASMQSKDD